MQTDNRFLDDLAKLTASAMGTVQGVRSEMEGAFRQRLEAMLAGMDLVRREEFEVVKAMAEAARLENEQLALKIAALEAKAAPATAGSPKPARVKSARAKTAKPAASK